MLQYQPDKEGILSDRIDFGSEEACAYLHEQFDKQADIVANLAQDTAGYHGDLE